MTKLPSKRNTVYLVEEERKYIKKTFSSRKSFDNEVEVLTRLEGLNLPKIQNIYELTLEIEYIEGEILIDYLNHPDADLELVAEGLANFLKAFHQEFNGLTLSDLNFHNFIVDKTGLYAIDFEKTKTGTLGHAAARIAAFALRDFERDKAMRLISLLLANLDIPLALIKKDTDRFLKYLKSRKKRKTI